MTELLRYKGFLGSIEVSLEGKCLYGKLQFIDDLVTYEAESIDQLQAEFKSAVEDYLDTCKKIGRDPLKPYTGTFNVRIGSELHQKVAQEATLKGTSINDFVKKALKEYIDKPEPKEIVHKHIHINTQEQTFETEYNQTLKIGALPWKKEPTVKIVH